MDRGSGREQTRRMIKANRIRGERNFHDDGTPLSGIEAIETILEHGERPVCLLAFSGGKDSLSAWLTLQKHFEEIIPYYAYRVPGLKWVDEMLDRYEQIFGQRILRVPDPHLYTMLRKFVWQPPNRWPWIHTASLMDFHWRDLELLIKLQLGLPEETFTATGVRAIDNHQRWIAVRKYGPIHWGKFSFMPIWDMRKDEVLSLLETHQIPLSIEYEWFGHSFGGLDYRHIAPIKDNAPTDWARIKEYFPLAHLEIARYEDLNRDYPFGDIGNDG